MEEFKYLIPEESIDAIITNVEKLREIENHLRHVFSNHGYNEVLMPSFEYVDLHDWSWHDFFCIITGSGCGIRGRLCCLCFK